eukprot:2581893-Alexandrium_andersonii.AAC.1
MDVLTKWQSNHGGNRSDTGRGRSPGGGGTQVRKPARSSSAAASESDQDTSGGEEPRSSDNRKKTIKKKKKTGAGDSARTPLATALQDVAKRTSGCTDAE